MLTKQVAIVQGPPGTGKTFTSVAAIKILVANLRDNDPPLIIAAQTNHALDQLLNHVMKFEARVVRLGGRSDKENTEILKRTLYELRTKNPGSYCFLLRSSISRESKSSHPRSSASLKFIESTY
jgi:helicase required for RNAi-mediated heterochromatin assembly 1